jgi:hypothetical protein
MIPRLTAIVTACGYSLFLYALSVIADAQQNCRSFHPISTLIGRRKLGFSISSQVALHRYSREFFAAVFGCSKGEDSDAVAGAQRFDESVGGGANERDIGAGRTGGV